jgi:hypothetical protein
MRTTVTLDKDVENLLRLAMRERGESFKAVLNNAVREGLRGASSRKTTVYRPMVFDMGKPLVELTKALSLAQELEDQETMRKHGRRT